MRARLRYLIEFGGSGGLLVHGAPGYWGRYASPQKVVELCSRLVGPEDDLTLTIPNEQEKQFPHSVNIWGHRQSGLVKIEIPSIRTQCGSFEREIEISQLKSVLNQLGEHCVQPEIHGYRYIEY